MSPLTTAGKWFAYAVEWLLLYSQSIINWVCLVLLLLIVVRYLTDRFNVNPFGRLPFYLRRPTDRWFYYVKQSSLYPAARRAFQFDPIWLLLLAGLLLLYLILPSLIFPVVGTLQAVSTTLLYFGAGRMSQGASALIGTLALVVVYGLMLMMVMLVLNSFFGVLERQARKAQTIIYPLITPVLFRIDPSGRLLPLFFLLLGIILQLIASKIAESFF
ncbi:MAG: hypothetical protein HOP19_29645 [Acidobacteria bacterium]|nr:hypothetical protein [Acidobacteriota bacterium]